MIAYILLPLADIAIINNKFIARNEFCNNNSLTWWNNVCTTHIYDKFLDQLSAHVFTSS